jgi:hypothetical protein
MESFVIGNAVLNVGLVGGSFGFAGYLFKRWMERVDAKLATAHEETVDAAEALDIKIERIFVELKIANGRTAKIEAKVESHLAVCEDRNKSRRIGDTCG